MKFVYHTTFYMKQLYKFTAFINIGNTVYVYVNINWKTHIYETLQGRNMASWVLHTFLSRDGAIATIIIHYKP